MCRHTPPCPPADSPDREAAHLAVHRPEQGWSLLCNGVLTFEDTGELLPDGQTIAPHRPPGRLTTPAPGNGSSESPAARSPGQAPGLHPITRRTPSMPTTPAAFLLDSFDWALQCLVERVPHTRSAVLLSSDGLAKSWSGLDEAAADRLAALASGLSGLADGAARLLQPNAAEELSLNVVVIDLGAVALLVCAGVEGSRLLVTADREADHGEVGYAMARLAGSLHDHITTPART